MYKVLCNGTTICDSRIEELALINPVIKLEENKAGSFSFKMAKNHPYYDTIQKRISVIEVWDDDALIFSGSCTECDKDFYNTKAFYCEGALAWLNDSIQRPARYQGVTVRGLLETLIANHNAQVDSFKQFQVGVVTVEDSNDSLYCYTNMESTMKCLKEDLVDDLGGIIRVRYEDGIRYIDYLADYVNTNSQIIRFGKNLLDLSSNMDSSDIATAIIPLGATQEAGTEVEGLETKLTIKDVNDGLDYVYSAEAVKNYGWIYKTVEWDEVTTPATLKTKGEKYLADIQFENMVINAKAVDMHIVEGSIEAFRMGDKIRVLSEPHGLDRFFPLTKLTINLDAREKDSVTLGKSERLSLTAKSNAANEAVKKALEEVPNRSEILAQAQENASNLIKMATNGYIVLNMDDKGNPIELLIMDTNDIETAQKAWRWNINGLGYSSTGYKGTYGTAITMDGKIVADYITTGTMQADRIKGGILKLGGSGNGNGAAQIVDASGNVLVTLDNKGITLADGVKIAWSNISGTETVLTKDTLKTESLEASNLKITGGSMNIQTASASENKIVLTYGNAKIYLAPAYVAVETETDRMEVSATGFMHSTKEGDTWYSRNYMSNYQFLIEQVIFKNDSDNCGNIKASGNEVVYTANNLHHFYGNTEFNDVVYLIKGGYLQYSTPITSDREVKNDLGGLDEEKTTNFIYSLKPVQFTYKSDEKQGIHHGLYAQDVKAAMGDEEWELYVDNSQNEEAPEQFRHLALRYEELIADLITTVQSQNKRIAILEDKLKEGA